MAARVKDRLAQAAAMLDDFAVRTGLTDAVQPRRYLWTDAFAVLTWIGLHEVTPDKRYLDLASRLVTQVHEVLGVCRDAEHPTSRGLRIGKRVSERAPNEPYDPQREWDRDGQYFHYLTKWMRALQRMGEVTGDRRYRLWAIELAQTAHRAFVHPGGIYWKMSIDLSRAQVKAMGAHDPLDGVVQFAALGLEREAQQLAALCAGRDFATDDALGAGGLIVDALFLARLAGFKPIFEQVMRDVTASVPAAVSAIRGPAPQRLPFRELGFALGLRALDALGEHVDIDALRRFIPTAADLEDYWRRAESQSAPTWRDHRDINAVSLAASMAPFGALG